ncbi:MAG: alpha/beta hydrolase [Ginsengibacter sp.]
MASSISKLVVFITGTFISNNCWDEWMIYFESEGYKCIAPAWPYKEATAQELRNGPADGAISLNTITSLTDHFATLINALPKKPILIGHSLGGLIVQLLLQRGAGIAGVAIHSFPPQGVNRFWLSFLKVTWETMMLFTSGKKTYMISFRKWKYAIANAMTYEQQKQSYYSYAIPESKKIIRDTFKCKTKIDFKNPHPPLLLTSGSNDKVVPASMNYDNYKRYKHSSSITDYKEFEGHTHLIFALSSWNKEADFILYWLHGIRN